MTLTEAADEIRRLAGGVLDGFDPPLPPAAWSGAVREWIGDTTAGAHATHWSPDHALAVADCLDVLSQYRERADHTYGCRDLDHDAGPCTCGKAKLDAASDAAVAKLEAKP